MPPRGATGRRLRSAGFPSKCAGALFVVGAMVASAAWAQWPAERTTPPSRATDTGAQAGVEETNGSTGFLFQQIQAIQDELRRLQGVIEEQGHRIDRLTREQKERYIDLDQRLLQVSGETAPAPSPAVAGVLSPSAAPLPAGEEQEYNAAFNVLKAARARPPAERDEGYAQALAMFDALIAKHPDGKRTANAFYWRGEIELSRDNLELARQAFTQVVGLFGAHPKVPDGLYKLGVVYHRLGEDEQALRNLDRVIAEYPDHSAARLARAYAAELR